MQQTQLETLILKESQIKSLRDSIAQSQQELAQAEQESQELQSLLSIELQFGFTYTYTSQSNEKYAFSRNPIGVYVNKLSILEL